MSTPTGHRLTFLPTLNEEMNEEGEPLKLTTSNLDQAIMEAAGLWPHEKPLLDYLLPCWKRAVKAASSSKSPTGPRLDVHEEAKRLALSNCLFSFTLPDLFGYVPPIAEGGVGF
jgi:ubiquitin conjugation factor E4 B